MKKPYQHDLFAASLVDARLRDERDAMEFPFFSLAKKKRTDPIEYNRNGVEITVTAPAEYGIATIWDADFLIWVASQWNEALERGESVSPRIWVVPNHFLLQTGRIRPDSRGGKPYKEFEAMLDRLKNTGNKTNIKADGKRRVESWSWIDRWGGHGPEKGPLKGIEVHISTWFFERVVKDRAVLAISPEYFMLTGGIERWLYKVARKRAGRNPYWEMPLRELYDRYPPGREYRKFKHELKELVATSSIPEYEMTWVEEREAIGFLRVDGGVRNPPLTKDKAAGE